MGDKTGKVERERRKVVKTRVREFFATLQNDLMRGVDVESLWARVEAKQRPDAKPIGQ